MSQNLFTILKRPVVTERTTELRESIHQYTFEVARAANKVQIRQAVESIFGVRVVDVRTAIVRGKIKRIKRTLGKQPNWKKAFVTVHPDDQIELFEGV
ncbi:MAG: 50S ribosomal protein L23 [Deltaproteobacteria bacterium HGW-Deltaproteobacteria-14]|jgi:large subunit ribosomal protein L23|nr:MAG: 50S ribosomal protein L23 [Deltaproteobacteria bacterium HGW-Deltaproteobacteria-14]